VSTHGAKFLATGGAHLMMIAPQKNEIEKELAELLKIKKKLAATKVVAQRANRIMQTKTKQWW
jgi:hypothetical protein